MIRRLLGGDITFVEETFFDFKQRYNGFGKHLYELIKKKHPDVFSALMFYRSLDIQPLDSYAIYVNGNKSFAIQLNYIGEVIALWNESKGFEIGVWSENEYDLAMKDIEEHFLSCSP